MKYYYTSLQNELVKPPGNDLEVNTNIKLLLLLSLLLLLLFFFFNEELITHNYCKETFTYNTVIKFCHG